MTEQTGQLLHLAFGGIDHPVVEIVRRVLMGTYKTRNGRAFTRAEMRLIETCIKPLFGSGTAHPRHKYLQQVLRSILKGTWRQVRDALLPAGKRQVLHQGIEQRMVLILLQETGSVTGDDPDLELIEASMRLAMLILLPEDINHLSPFDTRLYALDNRAAP